MSLRDSSTALLRAVALAAVLALPACSLLGGKKESPLQFSPRVQVDTDPAWPKVDGQLTLAPVQIGIMRRPGLSPSLSNAITSHITACLDNITPLTAADDLPEAEVKVFPRLSRLRPGNILPGW